jgi:hypothetical protein
MDDGRKCLFLFWELFLVGLEFDFALAKQAFYHLSNTFHPFCSGYFGDGVWSTICLSWP